MSRDVYVVVEHLEGKIADITFELLGRARDLARAAGGATVAVVVGHELAGLAGELGAADTVVLCQDAGLARYTPEGGTITVAVERVELADHDTDDAAPKVEQWAAAIARLNRHRHL